ncbi:terminase large subunit [Burkholderia pseudomallei]|uniref:terminase large subunit n=1 Tax=Burkholderia pseudomallei TaxID=28450 RepID=UPI002DB853DC|nr:terminase large subunit [Burkholderia pseudomallei]MEB5483878.1 terminase large subunit [Burkholderia pseudomallei]MEB5490593.1 terminase large subunit [Burkholderia pseudomallei]MEB5497261.1 terminase large subunit [Burkholderia pseudomallei]MEB5502431.1 terminase large subunit [Burkholderia pseudomallei]MEB5510066.1 terminase large subunit [Burkholderia pseudomallei]
MATNFPRVEQGLKFARDVVRGKRPACRYVQLACKRHLDDLAASRKKDFRWKFDPEVAERKLALIELLPHTKGEWAFKGQLVTLEPWQKFGLMATFGWLNKRTGKRRFRESYWEVPRKNGKSVIAAGVGIGMFVLDDEFGAEVYAGATTEKQAWEVFRPARLMVKRSPELIVAAGIEVNASNMNKPEDGSRFEPLIGNPGDGASPSCSIVDEYHEHDSAALYETMLTGMGARRQPLMFIITTAGANIEGPCYDKRRQVIEMLEGTVPDDELFGWIWTIDEGDDWTDPRVLAKANPNIGISVYQEYLESQQQRAIKSARFTNTFKTKHLNVWTSAKAGYFNLEDWKACEDRTLTLEQFERRDCVLALDMARKLDLNSMARLFWRDIEGRRHYFCVAPRFWVPEDTVRNTENRRMAERYQAWVNQGFLLETDGAEIDYRDILEEAKEANRLCPVQCTPLDPHGATNLSHQLEDEGLTPVTIVQNYTNMSDPMKEVEAAITAGRFHHDGNPIMTWCVSNVIGKNLPGNDDVVRPIKQGNDNKIDGAVALIMAVGRAMLADRVDAESIYDQGVGV